MPDLKQFHLPDVGEGLTEADILSWAVGPGDMVIVNQTLVEVETAKAAVELPSPFAGLVTALHAEVGETVEVGRPIITIDIAPTTWNGDAQPAAADDDVPAASERQAVLVGYGPRSGPATRRARRAVSADGPTPTAQASFVVNPSPADPATAPDQPASAPDQPAPAAPTGSTRSDEPGVPVSAAAPSATQAGARALAKPPVRKLAKSLGVDLGSVAATGPHGSVSREDVRRAVDARDDAPQSGSPGRSQGEERIAIRGVRKHTAAAMVASAFTAVHVTEFVTVDVSAMMQLRKRLATRPEFSAMKVSPLLLVVRAVLWAVRRTPIINSSWDEAAGEIVVKHYVNLGIAAATGRGLIVPNIKDAHTMSLRQLAVALSDLTETARAGRTAPADMAGGTITITNVGVFGVDTGTPILNPGESAIVAFGAVRRAPWVVEVDGVETIQPRWVTQLAVSFDHRVVDGEQGSLFLSDVAGVLADPGLALL